MKTEPRSKLSKADFFFLHGTERPREPILDPVYKWERIHRHNPLSGHSWVEAKKVGNDPLEYEVLGGFDKLSTHRTKSGAEKELKRRQNFLKVHQDLWEEWLSLTCEQRRAYRTTIPTTKGESL